MTMLDARTPPQKNGFQKICPRIDKGSNKLQLTQQCKINFDLRYIKYLDNA